jgi:putative hydrolase of the HAD superfamily
VIFFDIDRTLFDYDHATERAMEDFYAAHRERAGVEYPEFRRRWIEQYELYWPQYELGALSLKEQRILRMRGMFPEHDLTSVQAEKLAAVHNEAYISHWRLFDDAIPVLDHFRREKLGVISNGNVERQKAKLSRTDILDRFDVVVISAAYGYAKPDSRIFDTACELAGELPSDCIHIGDNLEADIRGAAAVGISPIWVNRVNADRGSIAAREVTSLMELID